jgi:hypothetical protein
LSSALRGSRHPSVTQRSALHAVRATVCLDATLSTIVARSHICRLIIVRLSFGAEAQHCAPAAHRQTRGRVSCLRARPLAVELATVPHMPSRNRSPSSSPPRPSSPLQRYLLRSYSSRAAARPRARSTSSVACFRVAARLRARSSATFFRVSQSTTSRPRRRRRLHRLRAVACAVAPTQPVANNALRPPLRRVGLGNASRLPSRCYAPRGAALRLALREKTRQYYTVRPETPRRDACPACVSSPCYVGVSISDCRRYSIAAKESVCDVGGTLL